MFSGPNGINAFSSIATDPHYDSNKIEQLVSSVLYSDCFRDVLFSEYDNYNIILS
jgi:hypothetical protein